MEISKKGTVAALKEAFKKGYEIVPMGGRIAVYTENWVLEADTRDLPLEVSQQLVEHYGGLPVEPMLVQKGRDGQLMFAEQARDRNEELIGYQDKPGYMHRVPVTYREKWVMFVTSDGKWLCVDQSYLNIVENLRECSTMMTDCGTALFTAEAMRLTIAPGRFGSEDSCKLEKIAEMFKEQRVQPAEEPENLCLFEDMEGE